MIQKNIKSSFILAVVLGVSIAYLSSVKSVTRENDELTITNVEENQIFIGETAVRWLVKDEDQRTIPVQLDLFSNTCANNGDYYGQITDNTENFAKIGNNTFEYRWDTFSSLKNKTKVSDGPYCLRICGTLLRDRNYYYSLCDTRTIDVQNSNRKPQILSTPSSTSLKVGDSFVYQINALDPDDDVLTYSITSGPSFITINSKSGLVSSKGKLSNEGSFIVKLRVQDTVGAFDEQLITLNIVKTDQNFTLTIISPVEKEIIKSDSIDIKWTVSSKSNISSIVLYHSKDSEKWTKIIDLDKDQTIYRWDVSKTNAGDYYIKVEVTLADGTKFNAVSGKFAIDKSGGSVPLISEVNPKEDSAITEKRHKIGANFAVFDGSVVNKNQTVISVDDATLSDCVKTDNSIECAPSEDLLAGKHKVKAVVIDSEKRMNTKEWYFELSTDNTTTTGTFGINMEQLKQILTVICCGLGAIIIPLILYKIIRMFINKRRESQTFTEPSAIPGSSFSTDSFQIGNSNDARWAVVNEPEAQVGVNPPTLSFEEQKPIEMPSSYTSDEIPDWLKTTDGDKPMSISGGEMKTFNSDAIPNIEDISKPHDE